ncbi:hypothetical protein F5X68DRAFT_227022 [Plectosphaerella plurivora]|uniref:Uncharacterized protein n=1 Tax=Plectosphaerella plurivora TaxID=936078 RepID=A0A9P8VIA2_9PEZI|nr:hypothetical protein F5X68DRAFT_227022 [Plectosphaerella plurivora]
MSLTIPEEYPSEVQGLETALVAGRTFSPLFVDDFPSFLENIPSPVIATDTAAVSHYAPSDKESEDQVEMEDVMTAKLEETPEDTAPVRVKEEVTDGNDFCSSSTGLNHHDVLADGQAEGFQLALPNETAPVTRSFTTQLPDPESHTTPAAHHSEGHGNLPPPADHSSVRYNIRYTIRNDHLQLTFSSRPTRPFEKAMQTFCDRAGTTVETTRWLFEEARVHTTDTPQSMDMDMELENTIWAHLETIGGGITTTKMI